MITLFIPMNLYRWNTIYSFMYSLTSLQPQPHPTPAREQWSICSPVTSAPRSSAAVCVHRYLVLRQLLNKLHFPMLPGQHVVPCLAPVLLSGPEYPRPPAVCRSCPPFQGTSQRLWLALHNGQSLPSALSSLAWQHSCGIRSAIRQ